MSNLVGYSRNKHSPLQLLPEFLYFQPQRKQEGYMSPYTQIPSRAEFLRPKKTEDCEAATRGNPGSGVL